MSTETDLIKRYFDAFNRHDLEAVMDCFASDAVILGSDGRRTEGEAEIRESYAKSFETFPDGKCVPRTMLGADGSGSVESVFRGTRAKNDESVELIGVEVLEFKGDKITALRDYHSRR